MLDVDRIDVFYGDLQALWDVSFRVDKGEIVVILGSNGAGKTTTFKAVTGLLHPKSGSIIFLGKQIQNFPPFEIVKLGLAHVPEGRRLFSSMSVLENLELGAYLPEARKKSADTLEWVLGIFPILKERRNQLAGSLSGGEQQMLAIARGLMSRPKMLLLDEPSLGLAPKFVLKIFDIIRKVNEDGVTILLVEQNIRHALTIADRGYVLETGRIVLEGDRNKLLKSEYVKKAYLGM